MSDGIAFTVAGVPISQGSKTRNKWGGVRDANPATRPWRYAVSARAREAMGDRDLLVGPVEINVRFVMPRPKAHYGTGRNAGTLKASAPLWCEHKPDADKLARAIGDSLTGIVFRDDAQVAMWTIRKVYGVSASAEIEVYELARESLRRAVEAATPPAEEAV